MRWNRSAIADLLSLSEPCTRMRVSGSCTARRVNTPQTAKLRFRAPERAKPGTNQDRRQTHQAMRASPAMYGRSTFGHRDRSVRVLVVLHHRDQRAADGDAGAVERVHELGLAGLRIAPARLHAARLEIGAVRARRDLAVASAATAARLRGRRSSRPRSPCRRCRAARGGTAGSSFSSTTSAQRVMRSCSSKLSARLGDADQLDLLELVLADHAARVLAVAAGFGAEARRVRGHAHRQRVGIEDLVAHDVGQRDFGGRNQVALRLADLRSRRDRPRTSAAGRCPASSRH